MQQPEQPDILPELEVSSAITRNLYDFSRWARFIAITGLIGLALFILLIIGAWNQLSSTLPTLFGDLSSELQGGTLLAIVLSIAFLIGGVLLFFLLRGALFTLRATQYRNQEDLLKGLTAYKIYFILYGVFSVISIAINLMNLF